MTAKADRAKELLDNPVLQDAFREVEAHYTNAMLDQGIDDADLLIKLRQLVHITREVKQTLEKFVETGELEDFRATENEKSGFLGDITKWRKRA